MFFLSDCNRLAFRAAQHIEQLGGVCVISGPYGTGRSSLLSQSGRPIDGATFVRSFIEDTRFDRLRTWREQMERDVLLIDDLQLLNGFEGAQNELATMLRRCRRAKRAALVTTTDWFGRGALKATLRHAVHVTLVPPDRELLEKIASHYGSSSAPETEHLGEFMAFLQLERIQNATLRLPGERRSRRRSRSVPE